MNYSTGSPAAQRDSFVTQSSDRLVMWDHRRTPGCADSSVSTPPRHNGRLNGLFYDCHVQAVKPANLDLKNFREPGSLPVEAAYPGE